MTRFAFLSIFILSLINGIYSQNHPDIGFLVSSSSNNLHLLNLEFRNPIKEKWKLNLGITAGGYDRNGATTWGVSDTIITARNSYLNQSAVSFRTGLERKIKSSIFSYGFDLAVGYRNYYQSQTNSYYIGSVIDSSSTPVYKEQSFNTFVIPDPLNASRTTHYLNTAAQLSLKVDLPLNDYFLLALYSRYSFDFGFKINETNVVDPLNDLPTSANLLSERSINVGIGVRYMIGVK